MELAKRCFAAVRNVQRVSDAIDLGDGIQERGFTSR
jgi:hypothetical protein